MRTLYRATLSLGLTLAALCSPATAQKQWAVTNTFHIGGEGSWDYVTVDPQTHRPVGDQGAEALWRREYRPGWEPKV